MKNISFLGSASEMCHICVLSSGQHSGIVLSGIVHSLVASPWVRLCSLMSAWVSSGCSGFH